MKHKRIIVSFIAVALLVSFAISPASAFSKIQAADPPEKAIYILPGFMESRLFSPTLLGTDLWVGAGLVTDVALDALGLRPEMANDSTGTGMAAYANRDLDKTGLFGLFAPMILSIQSTLALNGLSDDYEVEFFSYNWLQDLNVTAQELADDIEDKGYESVIFVTHSNGGLLASTFIAQSHENKSMVEKAIMLAPPLWGTFISLEGMETGSVNLFDGTALMGLVNLGYDIFVKPISKHWVKTWARSGPNMYQLTAGNEYINRVPIFYQTNSGISIVNDPDDYYDILRSSPSTNDLLVDGNTRSLRHLREDVFDEDVLGLWEGMDLTLVGCEYGFITATSAVYRQVNSQAIYAGTIYSKAGDWVVPGISMNGDGRFPYVNLPGSQHLLIFNDPRALNTINQVILNNALPVYTTYESSINQTSSISPEVGMSDMVRVSIKSNDPLTPGLLNTGLSVNVYDSNGLLAAKANGEAQTGFSENNFAYQSWDTEEQSTNILTYIPLEGYTLEVNTGITIGKGSSDITVVIEGLDPSGAVVTYNEYQLSGANLVSGTIFTLDGDVSLEPVPETGVSMTSVSSAEFKQNWKFTSERMTITANQSIQPAVTGQDASFMVPSNYTWSSSNTNVATVSSTGMITALSQGKSVITVMAQDNSFKRETIVVTVE